MEAAVEAAKKSVAKTPLLLPVLREAGVVDAGGQGLFVILEGALHFLKGEADELQYRKPQLVAATNPMPPKVAPLTTVQEEPYGYCTEFMITGEKLDVDRIRKRLDRKGVSLVVVGSEDTVRVHIHTLDPGAILHWAVSLGTLHQLKIQNMDDQHVDFMEMQKERLPTLEIGIIAVAAGQGITELLQSLGVSVIVPGGQTMNPSVRDILQAVESTPSDKVIILPNNKNIILTAAQVHTLTKKKVSVIPTKTIPQGVAALLAYNYEGTLDENTKAMEGAVSTVKTVEITKAVRSTRFDGLHIKRGQYIAIVDDEMLIANNDTIEPALMKALDKIRCEKTEVITLYYGADTKANQAEEIVQKVREKFPKAQVELVKGGQPHYNYIVSLEG
jgi:DAK2 domain fusion protein YloV